MKSMLACLAVSGLAAGLAMSDGEDEIRLLEPGEWHGDEVVIGTDPVWHGLASARSGHAWRRYRPMFKKVEDFIVDEPGQMTGTAVVVKGPQPLFLIQGPIPFRFGKVTTITRDGSNDFLERPDVPLILNRRSYRLLLTGYTVGRTPADKAELVLESGCRRQILYEWPESLIEGSCSLVWAGDLDGDGMLDLYMHLSNRDNAREHTLFLSSVARPNQLVRRAAMWSILGC